MACWAQRGLDAPPAPRPLPLKIPFIQENAWKRGERMTVRAASALTLFGPGIVMTFPRPSGGNARDYSNLARLLTLNGWVT